MSSTVEPLVVRWALGVDHPHDPTHDTVIHCTTAYGNKVELLLDDDQREALALMLIDPKGEMDQPNECCDTERGTLGYACRTCGDTQDDEDALAHACDHCGAAAGDPCGSECLPSVIR